MITEKFNKYQLNIESYDSFGSEIKMGIKPSHSGAVSLTQPSTLANI